MSKVDVARRDDIAAQLAACVGARRLRGVRAAVGASTGEGVDALVGELERRLPEGPRYYPEGVVTDQPEAFLAAELLREQLLKIARDELPHSIMVVVDEIEERETASGPLLAFHARVLVERDSQTGHRDRQGRRSAEDSRHRRAPGARGAARHAGAPRDAGEGGAPLAAPRPVARPARTVNTRRGQNIDAQVAARRGDPDRVPRRAGPGTVRAPRAGVRAAG